MANQGWTNAGGSGVQTSSTARQSGRGETTADTAFIHGSQCAAPGPDNDTLGSPGDVFEPAGQAAVTPEI